VLIYRLLLSWQLFEAPQNNNNASKKFMQCNRLYKYYISSRQQRVLAIEITVSKTIKR
jgi:hypothetical protein